MTYARAHTFNLLETFNGRCQSPPHSLGWAILNRVRPPAEPQFQSTLRYLHAVQAQLHRPQALPTPRIRIIFGYPGKLKTIAVFRADELTRSDRRKS